MSVDRAAAILARFRRPQRASSASSASCRPERPSTSRQRRLERGADRLSRRDGERVDRRRADGRDAARPARAGRIRGDVQPRSIPPGRRRFRCRPPAVIGGEAALERLRASGHHLVEGHRVAHAGAWRRLCVTLPFGTISLFELADFTVAHVARHIEQVERTRNRNLPIGPPRALGNPQGSADAYWGSSVYSWVGADGGARGGRLHAIVDVAGPALLVEVPNHRDKSACLLPILRRARLRLDQRDARLPVVGRLERPVDWHCGRSNRHRRSGHQLHRFGKFCPIAPLGNAIGGCGSAGGEPGGRAVHVRCRSVGSIHFRRGRRPLGRRWRR